MGKTWGLNENTLFLYIYVVNTKAPLRATNYFSVTVLCYSNAFRENAVKNKSCIKEMERKQRTHKGI